MEEDQEEDGEQGGNSIDWLKKHHYRVTHHVGQNLLLNSKQKFCFGLARPGQAKTEILFLSQWRQVLDNLMCLWQWFYRRAATRKRHSEILISFWYGSWKHFLISFLAFRNTYFPLPNFTKKLWYSWHWETIDSHCQETDWHIGIGSWLCCHKINCILDPSQRPGWCLGGLGRMSRFQPQGRSSWFASVLQQLHAIILSPILSFQLTMKGWLEMGIERFVLVIG